MKNKLYFINPAWSHNIFRWRQFFFDKYFYFFPLNHWEKEWQFWNFIKLVPKKLIIIFKNFLAFYDNSNLWIKQTDNVIIWDIFTNTLSYSLKKWNILYYSEFFTYNKSILKKILFYILTFLFFKNKKFIVPTLLSKISFWKISDRVLYFPMLYYWDINKSSKNDYEEINILFVWRISKKFKNIDFLIENFIEIKNKNIDLNLNLNLVWKIFDSKYLNWNITFLKNNRINYLWEKQPSELLEIYKKSDIFILPSDSDPIWAVILESMANGCSILVSDTVWASCYIKDYENWFIFKTNDKNDFQCKLIKLVTNKSLLENFKNQSYEIIRSEFWVLNNDLLEKKYNELKYFLKA